MPCWHYPLEVDIGLHVGIKNLMKTGVAHTACAKKRASGSSARIAEEIPVMLIDSGYQSIATGHDRLPAHSREKWDLTSVALHDADS